MIAPQVLRFAVLHGVLAPDDLFYFFQVTVAIYPPAAPVSFDAGQQPIALPPKQCSARDIVTITYFDGFIFACGFACNHGILSVVLTHNTYSKYSYDDTEKSLIVKSFFIYFNILTNYTVSCMPAETATPRVVPRFSGTPAGK